MGHLIIWTSVLIPYTILGYYVGGKYFSPGNLVAFPVAGVVLVHLIAYQKRIPWNLIWWHKYFLLFLASATFSTLVSPYFSQAIARGVLQVAGITSMLCLALAISWETSRRPEFFQEMIRYTMLGLGVVAVLGIIQFITFNVLRTQAGFAELLWFNNLAGGMVYKLPTELGTIFRPNSICREPSHLAQFLGLGAGVSLIRLGVLGRQMKLSISRAVPKWTAAAVVVCFALTLSVIAYALMGIILLCLVIVSRRVSWPLIRKLAVLFLVAGSMLGAIAHFSGSNFTNKLASVKLLLYVPINGLGELKAEYVSALAITSNIQVMMKNLEERPLLGVGMGGHPEAYHKHAPDYIRRPDMYGLNNTDAGGLLFRLLSETGLLGTGFFLAGLAALFAAARRRILDALPLREEALPLAIGITSALVGVAVVFFVRWGSYYDLELWTLMALTACIPLLFRPVPRDIEAGKSPSP